MKYISVVILVVLLSWTWCLATSERPVSLEQHRFVEEGVQKDVEGFIRKRYPTTAEMYCTQLYTESGNTAEELIARFRCVAASDPDADNATEQVFEGKLHLRSTDGFATWSETGGVINAKEVRFLNAIRVTPNGDKSSESEQ